MEYNVLKKIYNRLSIDVENYPPGITVEYRDGFGIAMNYADRPFEMSIPESEIIIGEKTIPTAGVVVWKIE